MPVLNAPPIRGELWRLTFGPESVFGTDPGSAYLKSVFGLVQTATIPDPAMEYQPFWALGDASKRNFYINYKGRKTLGGSIPDVWLLNGLPLYLPMGKVATTGIAASSPGVSTIALIEGDPPVGCAEGATVIDVNTDEGQWFSKGQSIVLECTSFADQTVVITDVTGDNITFTPVATHACLTADDALVKALGVAPGNTFVRAAEISNFEALQYIQIGTGAAAEVRKITAITDTTLFELDFPLTFTNLIGQALGEVIAPYTHAISESSILESITMQHELYDTEGNSELQRRFSGGKVGRATYSCAEGEQLRMSLDELIFNSYKVDSGDGMASIAPTYPTTEPYIFSYGALTLWGTEFARVRSFSLEISNALEPKYYMTDEATAYLPYEIREGRREYRLAVTIDIVDSTLFDELVKFGVNQGAAVDSKFKGFDVSLLFTRGSNDTITFTLPPSAADSGGDKQGAFIRSAPHNVVADPHQAVDLDILARSAKIDVVDKVANWFANIV